MNTSEIARVTVSYGMEGGSTAQNVFHMQLASGSVSDAVALADIANWVDAGWVDEWDNIASAGAYCEGFTADIMNDDGTVNRNLGGELFSGRDGAVVEDIEPAAVSYFMYAPTANPKIRGRKFIPGVAETTVDNGLVDAATLTALIDLAEYFTNTYVNGPNSYAMGVLSTVLNQFVPFTESYVISDVPAYQRRRKPGVGI